jgi:DNA-binding transcriptional ArsR family regulator
MRHLFDGSTTIVQKCSMVGKQSYTARLQRMTATTSASELASPRREDIRLEAVFAALSDPVRLQIVRALAASEEARACGTLGLSVSKSTASHHFRVLREAGVIVQREDGRRRMTELRRDDLDARFPGLLDTVISSG